MLEKKKTMVGWNNASVSVRMCSLGPSPSLADSKTRLLVLFPTWLQSTILKNTDRSAPKSYICGILSVKSHRVQGSLKKKEGKKKIAMWPLYGQLYDRAKTDQT